MASTVSKIYAFQRDDPPIPMSTTADRLSFAFPTARTRWPKILNQIIEEISSHLSTKVTFSAKEIQAGKEIQAQIISLRDQMANNAPLTPLQYDGGMDIENYNLEIGTISPRPTWLLVPWLFAECYLYRRVRTYFAVSSPIYWTTVDPFSTEKRKALVGSKKATIELVKHLLQVLDTGIISLDGKNQEALFVEMIQISLWGNATDLSLLAGGGVEELDSIQGKAAREKSRKNVLCDDTAAVYQMLKGLQHGDIPSSSGEIHIVLDNAGFELLADLALAAYLLKAGMTHKVVLHGKRIPWFVSDVNHHDYTELVDGLAKGSIHPPNEISSEDQQQLARFGKHVQDLREKEMLEFKAEMFWTTQHPFGRLPIADPSLYATLTNAELVIFKGDLNYRKLTYDGHWRHTVSFAEAIGPLGERQEEGDDDGIRLLALRTSKADVAVGLPEGVVETLPHDWTRSGEYAMISFCDTKSKSRSVPPSSQT